MALFSDPLAFLPSSALSSSSFSTVFPPLFPHWNNNDHSFTQQQQQQQTLDQLHSQVIDSVDLLQSQQHTTSSTTNKSSTRNNRRRINSKGGGLSQSQQQEPIAIMDLDHPLNSWLNTKTSVSNESSQLQFLGPLATRNGTEFPILPQFTYTALSNGSLIQIPVRTHQQHTT